MDPREEALRKTNASLEPDFKAAHEMLVAGKLEEAARALEVLEKRPGVPQPLLNWITLYRGLALLLAGNEPDARTIFTTLEERGAYSHDPADAINSISRGGLNLALIEQAAKCFRRQQWTHQVLPLSTIMTTNGRVFPM